MIYRLRWRNRHGPALVTKDAFVATRDCVVVEATNSMKWAVGKPIEKVIGWTIGKSMSISLIGQGCTLEEN